MNVIGKKKDNRTKFNARFKIEKDSLGEGGNGKVSLVRDKKSGEKVAVKSLIKGGKETTLFG